MKAINNINKNIPQQQKHTSASPHSHPTFYTFIQHSTLPSIMSTRPTRKAVNSRPSTDVLSGNIRRRTSEQVKKDQEAKKAATIAVERSNDSAKRQKQERIANLEDNLRKEDVLWEKMSVRPDLQHHDSATLTKRPEPEVAEPEDTDGLSYVASDSEVVANEGDFLFFVL
jgi:hypothetical protein